MPLWRRQAFGICLVGLAVAAWLVLVGTPIAPHAPFWTGYAVVVLCGVGVLIVVHARILEDRVSASPGPQPVGNPLSTRYDNAWKIALIGCFAAFFASLSVSTFRSYEWLAHDLMIATYVFMGLTLVLAALAGWTSGPH